jgi:hypothetical protein
MLDERAKANESTKTSGGLDELLSDSRLRSMSAQ